MDEEGTAVVITTEQDGETKALLSPPIIAHLQEAWVRKSIF